MSVLTFVAVLFFLTCCGARPAIVCYRNGEKGAELADLKELCEAEFTVPLCPMNKLLDTASSPSFADVMSSIKSIVSEMLNIIAPHIFELLCIVYIGTRWRANAAALLVSERASKESSEKFTEEKLRNGELLLEKQELEEEIKRLIDSDRDRHNMERLISDHFSAVVKNPEYFNILTFVDFNNQRWPRHRGKLLKYFVVDVKVSQTAFVLVQISKDDAKHFAKHFSLVETTAARNAEYRHKRIDIPKQSQEWLARRLKHIVVFSPSDDRSKMLSVDRLIPLFGDPERVLIHHLQQNAISDYISVSLCEGSWALARRSPGSDNYCTGENFIGLLPLIHTLRDPSRDRDREGSSEENVIALDITDQPDDGNNMDIDNDPQSSQPRYSECQQETQSVRQFDTILTSMRVVESKVDHLAVFVEEISSELRERNILYEEGLELGTEEKRREFGLHRDDVERDRLKKDLSRLQIDGVKLSYAQKETIVRMAWVSYYRDPSRPGADFVRCKLCNKDSGPYIPDSDHQACNEMDVETERIQRKRLRPGTGVLDKSANLLGENHVLCLKRFSNLSTSTKAIGITRLIESLKRHEKRSLEHERKYNEFVLAVRSFDRSLSPEVMAATVTSTLIAYTIAKLGLSFAKQFPLLLMAMKSGAVSTTAHYEATTAQRMVKQFAQHMKYDVLHYIISNNLPFSLLADGTSNDGVKWIVFLLRTVSPANRPITFHFSLVELESETADDIVNAFVSVLEKYSSWTGSDGLSIKPYDFAMEKIVALTSDGASVMTGSVNGVYTQLKRLMWDNSRREELILAVCSAHKLNLVVTSLSEHAIELAQATIMEMHHLFGSNLRTKGRAIYNKAAHDMGFPTLHMDKLHKVRWSASLQNALAKVLRMYPVLIEALERTAKDRSFPSSIRERAKVAAWVLKDGRTYIVLHHVNALLEHLTRISEALQNEESLLVDFLMRWRHLHFLLENQQIKHNVYRDLLKGRTLQLVDSATRRVQNVELDYLQNYYTSHPTSSSADSAPINFILAYNPKMFSDYNKHKQVDKMDEVLRDATEGSRALKHFRNLNAAGSDQEEEPDVNLGFSYHTEDAPDFDIGRLESLALGKVYSDGTGTLAAQNHIDAFYDEVKMSLKKHMTSSRSTEATEDFPYALDRHIILDVIECGGDFEHFNNCVLNGTSRESRGYPSYINEDGVVDTTARKALIINSIESIKRYCNLPSANYEFTRFYNNIGENVRRLRSWPLDLRSDRYSLRLYQTLLDNANELMLEDPIIEGIRCFLVIPASNADPERSFSTANRLSRGERSKLGTQTLDYLMT
ncbi:unnamed protein product [Nippostrongylus brasiliensis]|uniref:DUF4371 domain-containing protein n=1 Tax=Nippostrongylus brasiliensis TaxID=27835 RepID=A0A0N4XHQ1_NIPBR|nr:unnamed protein product [Nippostrongylus brasiliensis]